MIAYLLLAVVALFAPAQESQDKALEQYLNREMAKYTSWKLISVQYPTTVQNGAETLTIDEGKPFVYNAGYGYIPISLTNKKGVVSHSVLTVRLQVFSRVLRAAKDIKPNIDLLSDDFTEAEADITKLKGEIITDPLVLPSMRSAAFISQGTVLAKHMVRIKPMVQHGASVTAFLNQGGIEISFDAVAREDGTLGEKIRVVSKDKKIYRAVVVAPDRVKITE